LVKRRMGKGLSLLVVLVFVLGMVLAACNKSESPKESMPGTTTTPEQTSTPEQNTAPKEKPEISVSIYDRGNIPADEGTPNKNRWTEWINENAPVKVNFIPVPRWEEDPKYNTLLASGGMPDLIFTWTPPLRNRLYAQNQLLPLDEWIDKYSPNYKEVLEKYPSLKTLGTNADGNLYSLGGAAKLDVQNGLLIRADWLKKLDLTTPTTTEEFFNVMKAFAEQDPDGNNKKDTYGFHLSFVGDQIASYLFGSGVSFQVRNGEYVLDWDRIIAAATYKKQLYDANLIDRDYLTDQNGEKALQDFVNGKLGIYGITGMLSGEGLNVYKTLKANNPAAEVIAIPLPKSEFGQYSPDLAAPFYLSAVVSASAKNPEAVMQYIDFLLQPSTQRTLKYGIEGTHWQKDARGCPAPIDAEKNKQEVSWAFDFSMLSQPVSEGDCLDYVAQLNQENPVEKEYSEIIQQARIAYISKDRPIYSTVDSSTSPELPEDVMLSWSNGLVAVYDIFSKAIVGGASYPMDKAVSDARSAWEKAGGARVDEATAQWYADNKNHILLTSEYYK